MQVEKMPDFPPNSNPFCHDPYHMGTQLGSNVIVMHENHNDKPADYLIIVHIPTGQRIRVLLPEMKDREALHPDLFVAMRKHN